MQRQGMKRIVHSNSNAFAVVEATFVFPIMFMVFFALVLLALYLPQRTMLQRATQFSATAIATEMSDTWIYFDADSLTSGRYASHDALRDGKGGVYVTIYKSIFSSFKGGDSIVKNIDESENITVIANGDLKVECSLVNYIVYKEVIVTATRSIPVPFLTLIKFPTTIDLVVTSKAVVQNGDEFIRSVDIAVDFVAYLRNKFPAVNNIFEKVSQAGSKISNFFGVA